MATNKNKPATDSIKKTNKSSRSKKQSSASWPIGTCPVVGIGASAGGLAAFESFFRAMPSDKNLDMAFVLVQHLAPDHKSRLTEIIRRYTSMAVEEVVKGTPVERNCVYIIPPNCNLAFSNGSLQLSEPEAARGHRYPIDFLFRSLAKGLREKAVCIILSGTGSDGTLGMREIKSQGGLAIVQSKESSEFDGMPTSAIDTGLVDYVLSPQDMPGQLLAYGKSNFNPAEVPSTKNQDHKQNAFKKLFELMQSQTGHDFAEYKQSTVSRRIERRMAVHRIAKLEDYVNYMQQKPEEINVLFRDLLIGVTKFFRDPDAFAALENAIGSELFANKPAGSDMRAWICGCSTGEEVYSIAILLQEKLDSLSDDNAHQRCKVLIFASDIDTTAIEKARQGFFDQSIKDDMSPERLARYFVFNTETKTYRIQKRIRDTIIFSEQDVIKDPPFSKLDLVSCRNLMIYMEPALQKKVISLFHYALNQDGLLFLGTSETTGEMGALFATLERKQKLYKRKAHGYIARPPSANLFLPRASPDDSSSAPPTPHSIQLQKLAEKALIEQVVQAGILVNQTGDILYLHGRAGKYLEPVTGGLDSYNIFRMAREGLQSDLVVMLHKAASNNEIVRRAGLRVKTNGDFSNVNVSVSPVINGLAPKLASTLFMVVLEEETDQRIITPTSIDSGNNLANDTRIIALEQALRDKDSYIQSASEEQQSGVEELKSANEELQSINEELQSTNEELETSKEEIQSINEELATTNAELQTQALKSSHLNNDMNNLVVGTGIATIFLDMQLNILRFTPALVKIISLIAADIGRPLMHFTSTLSNYDDLEKDLRAMLLSLIPTEVEVKTKGGSYYMLRMLPYRTTDNRIEGAVVNFINITERKLAELALKKANERLHLATVVGDTSDAIVLYTLSGDILAFNRAAERIYGFSETEALNLNIVTLLPDSLQSAELSQIKLLSEKEGFEPYETRRLRKDGSSIAVWLTATGLIDKSGEVYAIATTERLSKTSE